MMYLHNDKDDFLEMITYVNEQHDIFSHTVEKDYYVTMLLKLLSEKIPYIVFKGGTSLSKCYKVIKRFSEDIDITIDDNLTQGQKKRVKQVIIDSAAELGMTIDNIENIRSRRDYNRYLISYKSIFPYDEKGVVPTIILETSYISVSFPTNVLSVSSLIGDVLIENNLDLDDEYGLKPFDMKVQGLERTFVDKIFAICDYYLQDNINKHSRHLYDVYKLLPYIHLDNDFRSFIGNVRKERSKSPVCVSSAPEYDISKLLNRIIDEDAYKQDYETITSLLLEEKVTYKDVVKALKQIADSGLF